MEDTKDQDAVTPWGFEVNVFFVWNESCFAVEKKKRQMQQGALMDVIKSRHAPDLDYRYVTCFCEQELTFIY